MFHCLPKYLGIIILNKNVLYYLVLLTKNNKLGVNFDYLDTKEKLTLPLFYKHLIHY